MRISFAIPAHNEEASLPRTIDAIHASARPLGVDYEIVVADDASTDATARVAREHGARVIGIERRQIAAARNAAARVGTGQILVFVDADTAINEKVLRAALNALEHGHVGGGASPRFDEPVPFYARLLLPCLNATFRALRLCGGCFVFCHRRTFEAVGGWDESLFAAEEIAFAGALKRQGRFITLRESVLTSGRKLRAYSPFELLMSSLGIIRRGRGAIQSREALGMWYGERRSDPADRRTMK